MMGMRRGALTVLAGVVASVGCQRVFDVDPRTFADAPGVPHGPGIDLVQTTSHAWHHNDPPTPLAFDNNVRAGDLIVAMVSTFDGDAHGVTDSAADDYELATTTSSNGNSKVSLYYATAKSTGPLTVVLATDLGNVGSSEASLILHDYNGAASMPFDSATQTNGLGLNNPNEVDVGPLVASVDHELMVIALAHDDAVNEAVDSPFQLEVIATNATDVTVPLFSADATVPTGGIDATLTMTGQSSWAAVMVGFVPQ